MSNILNTVDLLNKVVEQEKAALEFGFYWESANQLIQQIKSECDEVEAAQLTQNRAHLKEELGDLITATISLCIFLKYDPLDTLHESIHKFQKRYDALVTLAKEDGHKNLKNQPLHILLSYWERAKKITQDPL